MIKVWETHCITRVNDVDILEIQEIMGSMHIGGFKEYFIFLTNTKVEFTIIPRPYAVFLYRPYYSVHMDEKDFEFDKIKFFIVENKLMIAELI